MFFGDQGAFEGLGFRTLVLDCLHMFGVRVAFLGRRKAVGSQLTGLGLRVLGF